MPGPESHQEVSEFLTRGYSGHVSVVLALGWMSILLGRSTIPPLLPQIVEELSITPSQAGFAITVMMMLHALLQFPGGRVSDQLSRTTVLVAALGTAIVGFSLLMVVSTYPGFLIGVAVVGTGGGLYFTPTRAFLSDLFVDRRGEALGVQAAAGKVGNALAAGLATVALAIAGWQSAFAPSIVLLFVVLLLLHRASREPYVFERVDLRIRETGARLFGEARILRLIVTYSLWAVAMQGFVAFLPTLLQVDKALTPLLASTGFALVFVVGIVISPVAGRISDRFSRTLVAIVTLVLCILGLVGILLTQSFALIVVSILVMSVGLWGYPPVMQAFLMDRFPNDSMGGDFGAIKTIYTGIGSLGPSFVGIVAEQSDYMTAFVGLAAFFGLAIVAMVGSTRTA